jgi:hypothetical protein
MNDQMHHEIKCKHINQKEIGGKKANQKPSISETSGSKH